MDHIKLDSGSIHTINGIEFYTNDLLVTVKTKTVPRSFKEMFFTLPWKPFTPYKWTTYEVPDMNIYKYQFGYLAHPETMKKLIKEMEIENERK